MITDYPCWAHPNEAHLRNSHPYLQFLQQSSHFMAQSQTATRSEHEYPLLGDCHSVWHWEAPNGCCVNPQELPTHPLHSAFWLQSSVFRMNPAHGRAALWQLRTSMEGKGGSKQHSYPEKLNPLPQETIQPHRIHNLQWLRRSSRRPAWPLLLGATITHSLS